jgi:hypothetical protein
MGKVSVELNHAQDRTGGRSRGAGEVWTSAASYGALRAHRGTESAFVSGQPGTAEGPTTTANMFAGGYRGLQPVPRHPASWNTWIPKVSASQR